MIDAHIIPILGFDHSRMVQQLSRAGCTVHIAERVEGNTLAARIQGFSKGNHRYVTWVDPDDEIINLTWVDYARTRLQSSSHLAGIYPKWIRTKGGKITECGRPFHKSTFNRGFMPDAHHLTIVKRDLLLKYLTALNPSKIESQKFPEVLALTACANDGEFEMIPIIAYNWIYRHNSASSYGTTTRSTSPSTTHELPPT